MHSKLTDSTVLLGLLFHHFLTFTWETNRPLSWNMDC